MGKKLNISQSPHIHSGNTIGKLMWNVVLALMPAVCVATWVFGLQALAVCAVSIVGCVATEWMICKFLFKTTPEITDGSAVLTGLLLGLNLPSVLPLWIVLIGSVAAIGVGKMSFGGLGRNIWNPALVGRVFLLISFPAAMTTWPVGVSNGVDATTGATFLQHIKFQNIATVGDGINMLDIVVGNMNGSLGETGSIALLIGCIYLIYKDVITWHIPVITLLSASLFSFLLGGNPILDLFSGGLILGACFMATDYVTSPMSGKGKIVFGFMIGFITIIIRRYGAYPEGVSFAILLMNGFVPLINRYCRPSVVGKRAALKLERGEGL